MKKTNYNAYLTALSLTIMLPLMMGSSALTAMACEGNQKNDFTQNNPETEQVIEFRQETDENVENSGRHYSTPDENNVNLGRYLDNTPNDIGGAINRTEAIVIIHEADADFPPVLGGPDPNFHET